MEHRASHQSETQAGLQTWLGEGSCIISGAGEREYTGQGGPVALEAVCIEKMPGRVGLCCHRWHHI